MRIGIIGCGEIGALRAAAAGECSFPVSAVSDVELSRAKKLSARHGGTVFPDWQSLICADQVDAVIVCTPPHLHKDMCIAALNAGKHVLCEKPLGRNPQECCEIVDAARHANRLLATGFNYRFFPSVLKANEFLQKGWIGEVDHIRSYAGYSATEHGHPWIHDAEVMGGGALRDNGIHLIDLTRYFLGEVDEVTGFSTGSVWRFQDCEDNGYLLLRTSSNRVATVQASWTEWKGFRFSIEIYGTRGCIRLSCFPMITEILWTHETGGAIKKKTFRFPWLHVMEHLKSYRWVIIKSFVQELDAFAKAVRGEPSQIATGYDGLRAVEIASSARKR